MARCEVCGNDYDKCLEIAIGDAQHVFDCFECAISLLAPTCKHCGCRIIGHGMEVPGAFYCCAHCARSDPLAEDNQWMDRASKPTPVG